MLSQLGNESSSEHLLGAAGKAVRVLAVLWMAWALAGLAWLLSGHDDAALQPLPQAPAKRAAPVVDTSRLSALNLFGQAPVATAAQANAPDTSLQLRLAGVFVSADPENSSAIVAEPSAQSGILYRVNESLPGGATLEAVFEDRILLRRGTGSTEVLRFEKTNLLGGEPSASAPHASGSAPVPIAGSAPNVRALVADAAEAMTRSPLGFLQEMGLRAGGRGYEVSKDTPEEVRQAAGLQPGDRLLSVNGRPLGNVQVDRQLLDELKNGGTARVEIQRGGQIVTVERKF